MSLDRFWNDSLEVTVGLPKTAAWAAYCTLRGSIFPKELNRRIDKLGKMAPKIVFLGTEITFLGSVLVGAVYILSHKDNGPDVSPTKSPAGHVVPPLGTPTLGPTRIPTEFYVSPPPKPPTVSGGNGDKGGDGKGKGNGGNGDDDKKPQTEKSPDPKVTASRTPTSISAAQTRAAAEASATIAATQQATADKTPTKPATQAGSEMPPLPDGYEKFSYRPYNSGDMVVDSKLAIVGLSMPGAETHSGGFFAVSLGDNLWGLKHKNGKIVVIRIPYAPHPVYGKCAPEIGKRYSVLILAFTKVTNAEALSNKLAEWLGGGAPPTVEPTDLGFYPKISSGEYKPFVDIKGAVAGNCYLEITK